MYEHDVTEGAVMDVQKGGDSVDDVREVDDIKEKSARSEVEEPARIYVSHFRNEDVHSVYIRYGVPFYLLCALILLINADIGSGVSAEYILLRDGVVKEQQALLVASIFTSVKKLWENGSYPLAILVLLTSVIWPYVKLFVSFFVWFSPYERPRRRERLIEIMDVLGKWSFVDIIVLVQIMVAFRSVQRCRVKIKIQGSLVTD